MPLRGVIPFYCVIGNHDLGYGTGEKNVSKYGLEPYFQYALCDVREPEQQFNSGECWYTLFEEQNLLLVGVGWPPDVGGEDRMEWLNSVLDRYADVPAVILTHAYLDNNKLESHSGMKLRKEVISRHPNVRLILCGHHKGAVRVERTHEDGTTYHAVMYNLQAEKQKASGYCMRITFDPVTRNISFTSYSPVFDDYNFMDDPSQETFVLENAF